MPAPTVAVTRTAAAAAARGDGRRDTGRLPPLSTRGIFTMHTVHGRRQKYKPEWGVEFNATNKY